MARLLLCWSCLLPSSKSQRNLLGLLTLCIDEETMIAERSPILSQQKTSHTYDTNCFNYLITGNVPHVLNVQEKREIINAKIKAQEDLIDQIIKSLDDQISRLSNDSEKSWQNDIDIDSIRVGLKKYNDNLESAKKDLKIHNSKIRLLETEQADILISLERLKLLDSVYDSDVSRIDFLMDGKNFYEQLHDVECPLCLRTGETLLGNEISSKDMIIESCISEKNSIIHKRKELASTIASLEERGYVANDHIQKTHIRINDIEKDINEDLIPSLQEYQKIIDEYIEQERITAKKQELKSYKNYLVEQKISLDKQVPDTSSAEPAAFVDKQAIQRICDCIYEVLKRWEYPEIGTVAFDATYDVRDITIGGKSRSESGKGYRAITRSAFWVGVTEYCSCNELPFPCFLILDSPLLNVKQHSSQEMIEDEVKKAFFEDLLNTPLDRQVIILENEEPPEKVRAKCNFVLFTKDKSGHGGFIPTVDNN